jgi:hypothetical protein
MRITRLAIFALLCPVVSFAGPFLNEAVFNLDLGGKNYSINVREALKSLPKRNGCIENWPKEFGIYSSRSRAYWSKLTGTAPDDWVVTEASVRITEDSKLFVVITLEKNLIVSGIHGGYCILLTEEGNVIEYEEIEK